MPRSPNFVARRNCTLVPPTGLLASAMAPGTYGGGELRNSSARPADTVLWGPESVGKTQLELHLRRLSQTLAKANSDRMAKEQTFSRQCAAHRQGQLKRVTRRPACGNGHAT